MSFPISKDELHTLSLKGGSETLLRWFTNKTDILFLQTVREFLIIPKYYGRAWFQHNLSQQSDPMNTNGDQIAP